MRKPKSNHWVPPPQLTHPDELSFFVEVGLLLYNNSQNVLLDRQVLPFCHTSDFYFNRDFCYTRCHTLMKTTDYKNEPAEPCLDRSVKVGTLLHPESRMVHLYPDSALGFTGCYMESVPMTTEIFEFVSVLFSGGTNLKFRQQSEQAVETILPSFHVKVNMEELVALNNMSETDVADRLDLREQFDLETKSWGWFKKVECGPFVAAMGIDFTPSRAAELMQSIYRAFNMHGQIYIGMSSIAPSIWKTAAAPRSANRDHEFTDCVQAPFLFGRLKDVFHNTSYSVECESFHLVRPDSGNKTLCEAYASRILNGPAMATVGRLLGRSNPRGFDFANLLGPLPAVP